MSEFEYPNAILLNSTVKNAVETQVDYWAMFRKYILNKWYLYLLSGIFCLGCAYVFYKKQQPIYEVRSKLMILEREQDYGPAEDMIRRNVNFTAMSEKASNEVELLTSNALMTSVVEELHLGTRYIKKKKLSEFDAYHNFPVYVDTFLLRNPKKNAFEIKVLNKYSFQIVADHHTETHQFGRLINSKYGKFRFHRLPSVPVPTDTTLHIAFVDPKKIAKGYLGSLSVELTDAKNESSVLVLKMQDAVPQRGVDVLDLLIEKFNELKSESTTEMTLKTLDMIDGRLADISSELANAESIVESYKNNNDIYDETNTDLNITLEEVNSVEKEQRNLDAQMKMLQTMKGDLQDTTERFKLIPVNPALYDGKVQDLIQPYNDLVALRERLLLRGQSANPVVQANNQKLKSMRTSIASALDHMQDDLSLKMSRLGSQYDESFSRLKSVPRKERGLSGKVRLQSIKENLYVYLLQKREEAAMALVSNYTNAVLVDPPYSTLDPVAPSKVKIFAAAGMGGMAIPFMLILLLDLLQNSVVTEKDLKRILPEKNILGVINHQKGRKDLLIGQKQDMMTERFRSLRTNLQFHFREKKKCILVTSSTSNEGKTFIATNLAASFALAKKRTIVVDFDLRRPSVFRYFNGNPEIGLSSFFMEELSIDEIIQHSTELPTLDYIAGGPIIPNLLEMITEQQMSTFFSYLKGRYDVIIIDSAPIGIISDGILLSNFVDNTLYVVRSSITKKAMVEKARELFDQNKLVNPSIIFNGIKKQNDEYGYSYKSYGYSYKK